MERQAVVEFSPVPESFRRVLDLDGILWFSDLVKRVSTATPTAEGTVKQAAAETDSTAATVSDLKDDFNSLLAKLRASGTLGT